jgi:redox-sensitive bicupin YhaK (pirin superfamily)
MLAPAFGPFTSNQARAGVCGAQIVLQTRGSAHLMLVGGEPFPERRHIYWNCFLPQRNASSRPRTIGGNIGFQK